jgi:hypothetical protein
MSLHAIVYRGLENVSQEVRELVRTADPSTGEIEFIADELEARYSRDCLLAADVVLGNSSMILWLAKAIEKECKGKCQTLSKAFLYDGGHSGDFVPLSEVIKIKNELEMARLDAPHIEKEIRELAKKVGVLVSAAMTEGNPIVFT